MKVCDRISALQQLMEREGMQAYIVVTDDFHGSEYVGDYFKARGFLTGFTGSAGTLVVLENEACLWTDGRYFLQAADQLQGSGIRLMRMGEPGVPKITEYLEEHLLQNAVIGFDGRTISNALAEEVRDKLVQKQITFAYDKDLVDEIWEDRPPLSREPVWELDVTYAGISRKEKLLRVREAMAEQEADQMLVAALDEIAWLLNLRGGDVLCTPVFLAFLLLSRDGATLFAQEESFPDAVKSILKECGVELAAYEGIYGALSNLQEGQTLLLDGSSTNFALVQSIPGKVKILEKPSPIIAMKAVKSPEEMEHIRLAHVKDGVAVCRFLHWLKKTVAQSAAFASDGEKLSDGTCGEKESTNATLTELSAAAKLEEFRMQQEDYLGPSFTPILAYDAHGAIVHYDPTEETDAVLCNRGFCLADTGGHYLDGTTDITRTIVLGELTEEEKQAYTTVLRGHLNLGAVRFVQGVSDVNLDVLARGPLWEQGLDFRHGTGHGVGFLLNVHEGPQRFHYKVTKNPPVVLEEGMVISNEPGLYLEGKFGIRHENLVMVRKGEKTEYGQFMYLEPLTMVPFDREAILPGLLSDRELRLLNEYHAKVYETIGPLLEEEDSIWLRERTAPITP